MYFHRAEEKFFLCSATGYNSLSHSLTPDVGPDLSVTAPPFEEALLISRGT